MTSFAAGTRRDSPPGPAVRVARRPCSAATTPRLSGGRAPATWWARTSGNPVLVALAPEADAPGAPAGTTTREPTAEEATAEQTTADGTTADRTATEQLPQDAVREEDVPDPGEIKLPDEEMLGTSAAPVASLFRPTSPVGAGFVDEGRVGTIPVGTDPRSWPATFPRAFTDNGMTGTVTWAGGGGAGSHGNQGAGTIQTEVAPVFVPSPGPTAGKFSSRISPGTGKADVVRSYVGAASGDQGNGWFVTAAAAARLNNHEAQHVTSSRGFYMANLDPLLTRVANPALGVDAGASAAAAVAAHKAAINWAPSVSAFKTADLNANKPMGTVDTADLASGTYPVNAGPATVAGKAYTNVLKTPGEGMPAP